MPFVRHPTFENDVREVSPDQVDQFLAAGWEKVAKKDEDQAAFQVAYPQLHPDQT